MFRPVRAPALLVAAGLLAASALLLGACTDRSTDAADVPDPTGETLPQPASVVTLRLDVDSDDPDDVEAVVDVVRRRLDALGIDRTDIGWDGSTIEVLVADGDEDLLRAALAAPVQFELRPVVVVRSGGGADTGTADLSLEDLGPSVVDVSDVESASVVETPGGTRAVDLVLTEAGIARFNEAAARCFAADATCPDQGVGHGQLAIVVDGEILSAPAIQQPSFERDQIQITAADEAGAAALAAGTARATWTLRD